ncbi:helix-turn-helix domain-containing protein [Natronococcus sp. A-GB1]|uniref:winged helix-turn-helix domain-containing protein n=1 Tax=Natronococcus sp. A-GB1 TaxID=3037648 RepID=UPI00241FA579|nr:helix-turn-helix domain-containing protein [Natronococcus sp. A-GB1]MDG5761341.1 helix-turn-helix domain-containing protein [Natronococcus sp. A-GB1]
MCPNNPDQPQDLGNSDIDITTDPDRVFQEEPIIEVFNKPANLRILLILVDAAGAPLTVADIAEQAKVDRQTFYNNEELLLEYGLIERADQVGNAQRYCVDMTSEPVQAFMYLYDAMIDAAPQ